MTLTKIICMAALLLGVSLDAAGQRGGKTKYSVAVTLPGIGAGTVTSEPAGIACPSTCLVGFSAGTSVLLSARPEAGSYFSGWSGACSGQESECMLAALQNDVSVSANFEPIPNGGIAGGNFMIVDSQGKTVSTRNLEDGLNVLIEYVVDGEMHLVETGIGPSALEPGGNLRGIVAYESQDCTGTPYLLIDRSAPEYWLDPRLAVTAYYNDGIRIFYTAENPIPVDMQIFSILSSDGSTCDSDFSWQGIDFYAVYSANSMPISRWWVPPFQWK